MNWTEERVELLRKLWLEGLSASQIAAQMGGVSRNAVIGKVHRLKLSNRGRATAPARQKKSTQSTSGAKAAARVTQMRTVATTVGATALQVQFEAEPVARQMPRVIENLAMPISRELKLVELTERTCKWPSGDPLTEDFSFCGNDSKENSPYCSYHARIAFQPPADRRRSR